MGISTHVLDTSRGRPAAGVPVMLEEQAEDGSWSVVARATTDDDGRARGLVEDVVMRPAIFRLTFDTAAYFHTVGITSYFFPSATLVFIVDDPDQHYHVPLLLSPFGYSTYRGS